MSTTKAGRVVGVKNSVRSVDFWDVHSVSSRLSVKYVTSQTLEDMKINIIPIPFPPNAINDPLTLQSQPNILRKRSKIKREAPENFSNQLPGREGISKLPCDLTCHDNRASGDHVYSDGPTIVKEEVVVTSLGSGETIDLTLDEEEDNDICVIDIFDNENDNEDTTDQDGTKSDQDLVDKNMNGEEREAQNDKDISCSKSAEEAQNDKNISCSESVGEAQNCNSNDEQEHACDKDNQSNLENDEKNLEDGKITSDKDV